MATGIKTEEWNDSVQISEDIYDFSHDYKLDYEGKIDLKKILFTENENSYEEVVKSESKNAIYYGDNLDVLRLLLKNNDVNKKIKLIYIDPPYATNSFFRSREQKDSYKDDLIGSHYIEFLRRRLILLHELLAEDGLIYLHLDSNMVFEAKILLDEIFGKKNYRGMITRKKCSNKNSTTKTYGNISDYILFYSKTAHYVWNRPTISWTDEKIIKEYPNIDSKTGKRYKKVPIHAPGVRNGETGKAWRGKLPPEGKHWQYTPVKLDELDANGDIYWSSNGNPRRKVYLDEDKGVPVQDIWLDVPDSLNQNIKITGYPTEKNPLLLERIINSCTNKGDLVLDCFAGSGTTCGVAEKLERRWIGVDNSSEAISNIFKRFLVGLDLHGDYVTNNSKKSSKKINSLFEHLENNNEKSFKQVSFSFFSDNRHTSKIKEILNGYLSIIKL